MSNHWTIENTIDEFKTSKYLIKQARFVKAEKGILGQREVSLKGLKLTMEVKEKIVSFYEYDENSRMLPGAKDCFAIQTNEGKIHKQKRLVLCNLSELYAKWLKQYGREKAKQPTLKNAHFQEGHI